MKDENLRNIKYGVAKLYDNTQKYNKKVDRINELLNTDDVKEYLELTGERPLKYDYMDYDISNSFYACYNRELINVKDTSTNKIFVYIGSYFVKWYGGMNTKEVSVEIDDPRCEYRKYHDLEQYNSICVPIDKCSTFEKNNYVIYDNSNNFDNIKREFALDMLYEGQEKAKKYITKKYIKK